MELLKKSLDRILEMLAGVSFLAMVLLTCWQVLTRYVLQKPSSWSEELVSYLFAWMALLGASLVERLPKKAQRGFAVFSEGVAFLFSAVILLYGGLQIVDLAMGQMTSSLGVAIGVFYVVLPVCGVLNMLYTAMNIYGILTGRKGG